MVIIISKLVFEGLSIFFRKMVLTMGCTLGPRAGENVIPLTAVINPKITFMSDEKAKDIEGCFSLPLILQRNVPRSTRIECEYTTLTGERVKRELTDFPARVFQHEFDHLNGILAIDHTDDIIFSEDERSLEEVLGIKTGKELSTLFTFNPEKREYQKSNPLSLSLGNL